MRSWIGIEKAHGKENRDLFWVFFSCKCLNFALGAFFSFKSAFLQASLGTKRCISVVTRLICNYHLSLFSGFQFSQGWLCLRFLISYRFCFLLAVPERYTNTLSNYRTLGLALPGSYIRTTYLSFAISNASLHFSEQRNNVFFIISDM